MKNISKSKKIIFIIILAIVIGIICYYTYGINTESVDITNDEEILVKPNEQIGENEGKIVVHITGAVNKGGVVTLKENSRVTDAVAAAGGLRDDADMSKINLALILEDGSKINIPSINDIETSEEIMDEMEFIESMPDSSFKSENSIVNINKASQTELETLPGIGPSIALKIVNYREENGKFANIEDLKKVSGIGDSKFENIKNLITVK